MRLFHFTSKHHLPLILQSGFIRPTESNISFVRSHAGPDVVWLLDEEVPSAQHGLISSVNKLEVRIEVDVPGLKWKDWAPAQGADVPTMDLLMQTGGGQEAAEHWYVWPRSIARDRWVEVSEAS